MFVFTKPFQNSHKIEIGPHIYQSLKQICWFILLHNLAVINSIHNFGANLMNPCYHSLSQSAPSHIENHSSVRFDVPPVT